MTSSFFPPARASRMRSFGGPSVWLEFSPLSNLLSSINLGQGAPSFEPPHFFTKALSSAVTSPSLSQYARSSGAPSLVNEISRFYSPRVVPSDLRPERSLNPLTEVLVTVGASEALYLSCLAILDPDDEVVVISPAFDIYAGSVRMAGAREIEVPLRRKGNGETSQDWVLDMEEFAEKITKSTKMLILNSPHNPTGKVFSREEYLNILQILQQKAPSCIVLSDEVYEHLVFEGEHVPFASISPDAFERTLSVYSAGKTFSATGSKVGWVIGSARIMRDLQIAHQYVAFAINHAAQIAVAEALKEAENKYEGFPTYYAWLRGQYEERRAIMVQTVREAGMIPIIPQGAFYVCSEVPEGHPLRSALGLPGPVKELVDSGKLQIDSETIESMDYNICRNMVLKYGVTAIPVSAFIKDGRGSVELAANFVRFAFCKRREELEASRERLCTSPTESKRTGSHA